MCQQCIEKEMTRRRMMGVGALALGAMATLPLVGRAVAQSDEAPPETPKAALDRLKAGNERYVAGNPINTDFTVGRVERAAGQQPFAAIVSCADSRVAPEVIFDRGPGELFVVRIAGNFINEDGLASLEYGAAVLGVKTIVVLGHSGCGAVGAAISAVQDGTEFPGHVPSLIQALRPAAEAAIAAKAPDLSAAATIENAKLNAEFAKTAEPILSDRSESGKLETVAGVYDIATGKVNFV
jgi:carbonic anhydrase